MEGDFDYFAIKDNQNTNSEIYIYSYVDKKILKRNELVKISYTCYSSEHLGAGTFEFTYDKEAFEFFSFEKGEFLKDSSMYSTVNTNIEGFVKVSFACIDMEEKYNYDLFSIQLKVKANVDKDWNLKLETSGLTSKDGNTKYAAPVIENKVTTVYEQDKSLLPLMYLTSKKDEENKKLYITLSLEESSHLSAADIVITFDNSFLSYQSYQSLVTTLDDPMLGVNSNDSAKNGTIKVSWVYLKDLTQKVDFAQFTFDILDVVVDTTTSIGLNATGTRDSNLKEVDLAYQGVDVSLNINKHNWSDWETVNPATCAKDGLAKRTCSLCNKVETKVLPKTGVHFYGDWVVDKEPTCTKEGLKHKTCSVCGDTVTETIATLGHDYHSHREEPTCTKDGYVVEICSRCGDEINRVVLPATGHSYGDWVVDKDPTCTESGTRHKVCSDCGDVVTETLDALGHDLVHHDAKVPTCTESGYDAYDTCSRCGYSTYHEIPALGHDEGKWNVVREADCTHDGLEERRCTRCGALLESRTVGAKGHSYGDWIVDKGPTCTDTGTRHKVCSECGDVVTETVPALGHDYHSHREEPTCTKDGYVVDICSRCGDERNRVVLPATGHSYGEWIVDKEPTCTDTGTRHKVCSDCGDVVTETLDALGHDLVHHDGKPATCTESGYDAYDTCSRCGYSTYHEIPAKGHSYGDWIVDKEPTTSSEGSKSRTCSICGDTETVVIPKLQKKNKAGVIAAGCVGGVAVLGCSILIPLLIKKKKKKSDK
ncbi:MAG: cohesin domain-containing protein [Blautia sp.]|nr:cohesin domain-containing protein [Blautia sp.]